LANHLQAQKRTRQTLKREARNRHIRTTLRTYVKRVRAGVDASDREEAQSALKLAVQQLDKSVTKGILHRRTASRLISRLTTAVKKIQ
jgi:small subunit ribosomal protein S20